MRELDETDAEILRLLAEDARRPYSEIGDAVGLSGPAVSDRVAKLREAGVLRRFTVDVDRSQLRGGVPVLVTVTDGGPAADGTDADAIRDALADEDAVEHVFLAADGDVVFFARLPEGRVRDWLRERVGAAAAFDVRLVDEAAWTPSVGDTFAIECAECGNTVDSEGTAAEFGGERYRFCCPSCEARFGERYERFEEGA
jgi:DNA-binding Lrp family transcriptional regulator/YHS domain-containing protein